MCLHPTKCEIVFLARDRGSFQRELCCVSKGAEVFPGKRLSPVQHIPQTSHHPGGKAQQTLRGCNSSPVCRATATNPTAPSTPGPGQGTVSSHTHRECLKGVFLPSRAFSPSHRSEEGAQNPHIPFSLGVKITLLLQSGRGIFLREFGAASSLWSLETPDLSLALICL